LFCLHLETPLALFTFNLLHIFLAGKFSIYIQYNKIDYVLYCLIYNAEHNNKTLSRDYTEELWQVMIIIEQSNLTTHAWQIQKVLIL
jgi:hypothetical protein